MNEDAEKIARIAAKYDGPVPGWVVVELLAELDRRGAAIERVARIWRTGNPEAKEALRKQPGRWPELAAALDALDGEAT